MEWDPELKPSAFPKSLDLGRFEAWTAMLGKPNPERIRRHETSQVRMLRVAPVYFQLTHIDQRAVIPQYSTMTVIER